MKLRSKLIIFTSLVYVCVSIIAIVGFYYITDKVIINLGSDYIQKQALLEKEKIFSFLKPEIVLALKMVDSPVIKKWCLDEYNPQISELAKLEMQNYKKHFIDNSYFLAMSKSGHYYMNNPSKKFSNQDVMVALKKNNPADQWFFESLKKVKFFELKVDFDPHVNTTKVWINAIIRGKNNDVLGIGGSGIEITDFINRTIKNDDKNLVHILIDENGAIQAHSNKKYMEYNARVWNTGKKITFSDLPEYKSEQTALPIFLSKLKHSKNDIMAINFSSKGKKYLLAASYMPELNWFNIVILDVDNIFNLKHFYPILLLLFFAFSLSMIIMGFIVDKIILSPLASLSNSTKEITKGNYYISLESKGNDELSLLKESFNEMISKVRNYTFELENKVAYRTKELEISTNLLKESEARYRLLIDNYPLPIVLIEQNTNSIIYINQLAADMFEIAVEEAIGYNALSFYVVDIETSKNYLETIENKGIVDNYEMIFRTKTGKNFPAIISSRKIVFDNKLCRITTVMDISIRKTMEEELKKSSEKLILLNNQLQESNATKDKFFSIIAHDLRGPFSTITSYIELIKDEIEEMGNKELSNEFISLRNTSKKTYELMENLLIWASSQKGNLEYNPETYNFNDLVESNIELFKQTALRKKISLKNNLKDELEITFDYNMINTVIRNLINNAIKYSNINGEITISSNKNNKHVEITVEDNGIGMTKQIATNLFKVGVKQYSHEGTYGEIGSGLGLVLCKEFIEKHDGKISVESELGKGSKFKVTLPVES